LRKPKQLAHQISVAALLRLTSLSFQETLLHMNIFPNLMPCLSFVSKMYKIYVHMFMEVFKLREFASTPNQVKGC